MKYMGSKGRLAKYILPIILKDRVDGQSYVEPFVGGANLIDKVDNPRYAADSNECLIACLKKLSKGTDGIPKDNTETNESEYKEIKNDELCEKWIKGYYGFALSYGGKWFGGWRRDKEGKRDYVAEAYRNAVKQAPKLEGIKFKASTFEELNIPPNSIIYCDPPYEGTTKYKDEFNHSKFWGWCREKAKDGHTIFVSEYNAPKDFEVVWSMTVNSSLDKDTGGKKAVEKLFRIKGEKQ